MFFGMMSIYLSCFICFFTAVETINLANINSLVSKRYNVIIFGIWSMSLLWASLPFFKYGRYILEPHKTSCLLDWIEMDEKSKAYLYALCILGYALPVGIAIWSQYKLKKHLAGGITKSSKKNDERIEMLIKMNNSILSFTIFGWLPYGILAMNALFSNQITISPFVYYLPQLVAKLAEALIPTSYSQTMKLLDTVKKSE
ncbi:unnamed protein product [Heterobilharzia americana]|nr:unnamed protein product [Heterobilharzia americana]